MKILNWEEAPEGTTHALWNKPHEPGWRKIEIDEVYHYNEDEEWEALEYNPDEWLEKFGAIIHERPKAPPPVEAELPNGKVWPEWADYYVPYAGGFFFDEEGYQLPKNPKFNWMVKGHPIAWVEYPGTIARFPNKQQVKKEEPPKKRAVGWWN